MSENCALNASRSHTYPVLLLFLVCFKGTGVTLFHCSTVPLLVAIPFDTADANVAREKLVNGDVELIGKILTSESV